MANNKMNEMDAKIPTKLSQLQNDKNFLTAKDGQKSGTSMGEKSVAFGSNNEITGEGAFVHGENCIASGKMSYAGGGACRAIGEYSHGEGCNDPYYNEPVIAEGIGSHAEGRGTRATNSSSHAEGEKTLSSGNAGHAEGKYSEASGEGAHSENISTMASGFASHAEGENTVANGLCQHVQGKYNISDPNKAHIVGGGTSNIDRKNIHTLDWQGNAEFAGDVVANGCNSGEDPVSLIELSNKIKDLTVTAPQTQVVWEGALYFNTNDTIYFKIPKTHIHNQHITLLLEMTTRSNQLSDRAGDMAQIVSLSLNDTYSSGDYYNSIYPSFGGFVEALTGDYAVYLNKPSAYDGDYIMCAIRPSTNVKDQNAHLSCVSVLYSREKTN